MVNGNRRADDTSTRLARPVIALHGKQSSLAPATTTVRALPADPHHRIGAGFVKRSERAATGVRTESPLDTVLTKLPRLALECLTAVFAGKRQRRHPLVVRLACAYWRAGVLARAAPDSVHMVHHMTTTALSRAKLLALKTIGRNHHDRAADLAWLRLLHVLIHGESIPRTAGSGTVGVVALRYGRNYIGVELNPDYVAMARRRIVGDAPLFNSVSVVSPVR